MIFPVRSGCAFLALATFLLGGCKEEVVPIPPPALHQSSVDISLLYKPRYRWAKKKGNFKRYQDNRKIALLTYAPWSVPRNPTWAENPYRNISWQFHYHSLTWLYIPALGFDATGDASYLSQVKHYVLDWIANHPAPIKGAAWYDHAVVYRSATIAYLYYKYFEKTFSKQEKNALLTSLGVHGTELRRLVRDPSFRASNHSLFHSMALFNLSVAFPQFPHARQWRADSRKRIAELMTEMVHVKEGVSIEQSTRYHWGCLSLLHKANALLRKYGSGLEKESLSVLHGMVDFAALMRWPDGSLPAIGDTDYKDPIKTSRALKRLRKHGYGTAITDYLALGKGTEPRDAITFPESGYSIFRPSYARDFTLIVDMGPSRFLHGHNDAMNVLMYAHGAPLLIDPGGPYIYGDPLRKYFLHARAHNTVVVNNRDYGPGDVTITRHLDTPVFSFVEGFHTKYRGVVHRRTVFLIKPDLVVILDALASARDNNTYTLTWHFPPGSKAGATSETDIVLSVGKTAGLRMAVQSRVSSILKVVEGQFSPYAQGWVTPAFGRKVPAPVAQFEQQGKDVWFVTVVKPSSTPDKAKLSVSAKNAGGNWDVTVHAPGRTCSISLPPSGAPRIAVKLK